MYYLLLINIVNTINISICIYIYISHKFSYVTCCDLNNIFNCIIYFKAFKELVDVLRNLYLSTAKYCEPTRYISVYQNCNPSN